MDRHKSWLIFIAQAYHSLRMENLSQGPPGMVAILDFMRKFVFAITFQCLDGSSWNLAHFHRPGLALTQNGKFESGTPRNGGHLGFYAKICFRNNFWMPWWIFTKPGSFSSPRPSAHSASTIWVGDPPEWQPISILVYIYGHLGTFELIPYVCEAMHHLRL